MNRQGRIVGHPYTGPQNGGRTQQHSNSQHLNGNGVQQLQQQRDKQHLSNSTQGGCVPNSPLAHHNYTWPPDSAPSAVYSSNTRTGGGNMNTSNGNGTYQYQQCNGTIIKHARASPRPSQVAPYPSPSCVHQHHNYSSTAAANANHLNNHNNNNNNSSANNVLQQLSQQNISFSTQHHSNKNNNHHQQQQQQTTVATVTITPNFSSTTHQLVGQQRGGGGGENGVSKQSNHQHSPITITTAHNDNSKGGVGGISSSAVTTGLGHMPHHIQHVNVQQATKHMTNSPNRRTRGEKKKCRKVYGMDRRDMWCTQCRWKKACSRFGD